MLSMDWKSFTSDKKGYLFGSPRTLNQSWKADFFTAKEVFE